MVRVAVFLSLLVVTIAGVVAFFVALQADASPEERSAPKGASGTSVTWTATAVDHRGRIDAEIAYHCPPGGTPGPVWGTDVYTDDSSVCTAAVHAGRLTRAGGGSVRIQIGPAKESFAGSHRHGVTSADYGAWEGSFVFVGPRAE